MIFSNLINRHIALIVTTLALGALRTTACSVPVFRYALERESWAPARYPVFVFYQDRLTPQAEEAVKLLRSAENRVTGRSARRTPATEQANINLVTVDVSKPLTDKRLALLWRISQPLRLPAIVVTLPPSTKRKTPQPVWRGPATPAAAAALLNSPARSAIVNALAEGNAAVWLVADGSDPQQNRAAKELIQQECARFAENFEINPEALEVLQKETNGKFQLKFSVISMNPHAPEEKIFYAIIRAMDSEIKTDKEPVSIPVFGRGRMLPPVTQSKLTSNLVNYVSEYLAGDCSCEIKWQNPGTDGLFSANWYKVLAGVGTQEKSATPAAVGDANGGGISSNTASATAAPQKKDATESAAEPQNSVAALFLILIILAAGATVIILRSRHGCCRV